MASGDSRVSISTSLFLGSVVTIASGSIALMALVIVSPSVVMR